MQEKAGQTTTERATIQSSSRVEQSGKIYAISSGNTSARYILMGFLSYFSAELGTSYAQQSIVVSVRNVGRSFLQGFWGNQSDKHGRRIFLVLGYFTMGLTLLLFTQIRSVPLFIALVAIQMTVGSAAMPAFDSTMGDVVAPSKRGAFLGKVTSVGSLVAVVVLLLAGWLMDWQAATGPDRFTLPFLVGAICLFSAAMMSISLKETLQHKTSTKGPNQLDILKKHSAYRRLVLINGLFFFAMSLAWPLFAFVMKDIVHATGSQISMIWAIITITAAISTRYGGILSDRVGRKPLVIIGRVILCLVPLLYGLTSIYPTWVLLLLAEFISGISVGLGMTVVRIMSLDLAPPDQKAAFSGVIMSVTGITSFFGSLIAGVATQILEVNMGHINALVFMLYVGAILRLVTSFGFLFVKETAPNKIS